MSVTVAGELVSAEENGTYLIDATSFVLGNANSSNVQVRMSSIKVYTNREVTVYSAYATNQYAVTFDDTPDDGTLAVKKQVAEEWTAISSGEKFWKGTTLKVVATATTAGYALATLTANGTDIKSTGEFTVGAADVVVEATFHDATGFEDVETSVKAVKVLRNGVLYIEKNGHTYNAMGQLVK